MFRKLYFVTEQSNAQNEYRATGVYTSIHDLIDKGLRWIDPSTGKFRISLVKLDCRSDVLAAWEGPEFLGMESNLQEFVTTGEFGIDEVRSLCEAASGFTKAPAKS